MKNKKMFLAVIGLCLTLVPVTAQTVYDAAKIADKDLNGTARFVGMGGAMSALGGDISTIGTNPAGIGIYRSHDVMTSFSLSSFGTDANYMGNNLSTSKMKGSYDNLGFVLSTKIGNKTTLRYVNFGFNYHKSNSFYGNMEMGGDLGNQSQSYYMAQQAAGIESWGNSPYTDVNIGWLSVLGYDGWLITDITTDKTGTPYLDEDGNQINDVNGNPLYRAPGVYYGLYDNGNASYRSEQRGGIEQYDFNISFNIKDRVYLGLTLGAYSVDYNKYTTYGESYENGEYYSLTSNNQIVGAGFDVKVGAIIRPFEYSPLRVGLAVHTPTFYSLDYKTRAYVESSLYDPVTGKNEAASVATENIVDGDMIREFRLQTPWLYNVSLGYTIGNSWALGAEYEYQDYSSMEFRDPQGFSDSFEFENSTTAMLKGVHTFRAGLEYKVIPLFAIRAGYNYRSALFNKDAFKDLPINSIQTDTDFSNTQALNNYTVGIGYRGSMFYADLAYKFTSCKSDFYPFVNMNQTDNVLEITSPEATKVTDSRSQVLLTLGVRF